MINIVSASQCKSPVSKFELKTKTIISLSSMCQKSLVTSFVKVTLCIMSDTLYLVFFLNPSSVDKYFPSKTIADPI